MALKKTKDRANKPAAYCDRAALHAALPASAQLRMGELTANNPWRAKNRKTHLRLNFENPKTKRRRLILMVFLKMRKCIRRIKALLFKSFIFASFTHDQRRTIRSKYLIQTK